MHVCYDKYNAFIILLNDLNASAVYMYETVPSLCWLVYAMLTFSFVYAPCQVYISCVLNVSNGICKSSVTFVR